MALTKTPSELTAADITITTAAQPNVTSLGTLTALQVDNVNINGNTISNTDTNGNLVITPNGTGNLNINTSTVGIMGAEGESAKLSIQSDEADDHGDIWSFVSNTGNTLTIENDISGSSVAHMTLTPNATVASSTVTIPGSLGINDTAPPRRLSITGEDGAYSGQTSGNSRTHLLLENNGSNYIEFLNAEANSAAIFWSNEDGQNQGAIEYKDSHMYLQAHGQANQLVLDSQYGYVHLTGSNDVRLTLSTEGTAGNNSANWVRGNSAGLTCNAKESGKHMWEINGTEEMSLNATRLHVNGSVQFSASATDANRYNVYWNSSNGGLIVVSSDKRLKKDFDFDLSGIETIKKLKPVRFTWKESERRQLGFLAQDAILADEHLAWNDTETDQWGLDGWEGYVAMLTKAIQEQQALIETLQAEVKALKES